MDLKKLYQAADTKALNFYRKHAEKWEARGHNEYGLPLLVTLLSPESGAVGYLDSLDNVLNWMGFSIATPEPTQSWSDDIRDYSDQRKKGEISKFEYCEKVLSRVGIEITSPLTTMFRKIYGYGYATENLPQDPSKSLEGFNAFTKANRLIRLPMISAGAFLLAKAGVEFAYSLIENQPLNAAETGVEFRVGLELFVTRSSAYWKDSSHPDIGKKQRTAKQVLADWYETAKEKLTKPVPIKMCLEDMV